MNPRWFQLLRAQQLRGRNALTIPFLIGCLRHPSGRDTTRPEAARQEIYALLSSFLEDTPVQHAVSIYRCPDIRQPVAIEFYSGYSRPNVIGLESQTQGRPTLYVSPEFAPNGTFSLSSLTEQLFVELHSHICAGHFSHILGNYVPFTVDDRAFIEFSKNLTDGTA